MMANNNAKAGAGGLGFYLGLAPWLALALALVPAVGVAQERDFAYLPVYSQPAADLVEVLRPMVGGGSLVAHRDKLIVRGTQAEIAAVSRALEQLDRPLRRLIIEVRVAERSVGQRAGSHLGAGWEHTDGRDQVRIDAGTREIRTRRGEDLVQQVQTLDGHPALIQTGEARPVNTLLGVWPGAGGALLEQHYQAAETGFYALPRTHGDEVTVELYQQKEALLPNGRLRAGAARTQVRGWLGEWLEIGGEQRLEQAGVRRWSTEDAAERRLQLRVRSLD